MPERTSLPRPCATCHRTVVAANKVIRTVDSRNWRLLVYFRGSFRYTVWRIEMIPTGFVSRGGAVSFPKVASFDHIRCLVYFMGAFAVAERLSTLRILTFSKCQRCSGHSFVVPVAFSLLFRFRQTRNAPPTMPPQKRPTVYPNRRLRPRRQLP